MAKILLVEDDKSLADPLIEWLQLEGHVVEHICDGNDAMQMLNHYRYDVMVLDWGLPGKTGIEVLKEYRAMGGVMPVIFLTGQNDTPSKKEGLDTGADDYLTKPFDTEELSARIRSLLRRPATLLGVEITIGNTTLEPATKKVFVDGKPVVLGKREFAVLEFLMRHPDQLFSSQELIEAVWPSDTDSSEDAVRTCMRALRLKLGGGGDCIISTVRPSGYTVRSG